MKKIIKSIFRTFGFDITKFNPQPAQYPKDFDQNTVDICLKVKPFTMTTPERIFSLIEAIKYLNTNNIKGDFVECGVWKGGSTMAMALSLQSLGDTSRDLYLYDTYEGMSSPTKEDVTASGICASKKFEETQLSDDSSDWCNSSLEEVTSNVASTKYPSDKLHFIKGKVEDTIPNTLPNEIALLRLDTDWYNSTKHEMIHLFPLLKKNGVLIIDDYGHWEGAKKAIDEYIKDNNIQILLNRIDNTGRIAIKI